MRNPFLVNGVLNATTSINKLEIGEMPTNVVKQNLEGKSAIEIFSTELLVQEIKNRGYQLKLEYDGIEEKLLPYYLEECLFSDDDNIQKAANEILQLFGERLAIILLCLKKGNRKEQVLRKDWDEKHWLFWNQIETVIFVGGLANDKIGQTLKFFVEKVFSEAEEVGYQIILGKDSAFAGLRGCANYLTDSSEREVNLIFDFGQSFTKRSFVETNKFGEKNIVVLDSILSRRVDWDIEDSQCEYKEAVLLNENFVNILSATNEEVIQKGYIIGKEIIISIANYVNDGRIVNRGGYGKLRLIADNYAKYLEERLAQNGYHFSVRLIHDGTAMAAGYSNYNKAVCISLGTAFGVGFPIEK